MVETIELTASIRDVHGKASVRRLRRIEDMVPGTIYGAGKKPTSIMMPHKDIFKALSHEATYSSILTLLIGSKKEKVVLKALQRHPSKPYIMHVDFQRIKATEKLHMTVPIHFLGEEEAPGLEEGAIFSKSIAEIEITCLPADLPEAIELDVSKMGLDDSLHLSDLKIPQGVELTVELDEEHNVPVITLHMPKVSKEDLEAEAAEAALAAEAAAESAAETEESAEEKAEGEDDNESKDDAEAKKDAKPEGEQENKE